MTGLVGAAIGALVRGPVGAVVGGFVGILLAPPRRRWFGWILTRNEKKTILGPFLLADESAIQQHREAVATGEKLSRVVLTPTGWVPDDRA